MEKLNYFEQMLLPQERGVLTYVPTMPLLLDELEKRYADKPALSDGETTYTYQEMLCRVARRRKTLADLQLPENAVVAVLDNNSINAMELFLAIISAGYTAMMLPAGLPAPAVCGCAKRFDFACLFAGEALMDKTADVPVQVLPAGQMADAPAPMANVTAATRAAIFFTGGTTGAPKGAVLSHGALMRGTYNGTYMPGPIFGHRYIAVLPLSHVFGLIRSMLSCLFTGSLVYSCEQMPKLFQLMAVAKPTVLVLVPGLADVLLGAVQMRGKGVLGGQLKTIVSGGAPVPPRLMKAFAQLGISLIAGYGLTETANFVCGNVDTDRFPDPVGPQYPNQERKIVNGELWVKGDMLFDGYYKDEKATSSCMEDGWFKTGDLVAEGENGFLTITGRIKNLILLPNGENVSPEAVEEAFYKSEAVRDCLAREDDVNGVPVIGLEVLLQPGKTEQDFKADMAKINHTLPATMRVVKVTFRTEEFKKTASMKIARQQ